MFVSTWQCVYCCLHSACLSCGSLFVFGFGESGATGPDVLLEVASEVEDDDDEDGALI